MAATGSILDFQSEWFYLLLIYKSPWYFLSSFQSTGLSVQKKFEIDFQDGNCGNHTGFPIRTNWAIFLSASHPDTSYQVSRKLVFQLKEEVQNSIR